MAKDKPQALAMAEFKVNGREYSVNVLPDTPLLWVLRDTK